jgi:glycosyltransferase involved in cell wall biosynthesis
MAGIAHDSEVSDSSQMMTTAHPQAVAYVFLDFGDGGAQRLMLATWRHLDRARYRPALVCLRRQGALVEAAVAAGVPVHVLGRLHGSVDLGAAVELVRLLRRMRAQVVHAPSYSRACPYAQVAAQLAGVPLTVVHDWNRASAPPARRLADRLLRPGAHFVATSRAQAARLRAEGVAPGAIAVVTSGIDVEPFLRSDRAAARRALGLAPDEPVVLVPARLHPMKGHVDLLAALPELRRRVPDVRALCAGDGPLSESLPRLAEALGVADAVRFLGHRDDIPQWLAAADLVVLPSRSEGLPAAVLEAMAARRCVLATAVGGLPEVIADGRTGRLVPPADPPALAGAMAELLADRGQRARLAAAAQVAVLERYQAAATTRQLEAVYARWLRPSRRLRQPGPTGRAAGTTVGP